MKPFAILYIQIILTISLNCGWTQPVSFYHLSTAEGLSDNRVNSVARDRNGILWIGTSEGLNSFDGNRITAYYKYKYPEIPVNNIERILIDPENRIWIRTNSHYITMLDEKRKFHKFLVGDTSDVRMVSSIFYSPTRGVFALKSGQHYFQDKNNSGQFQQISLPFDTMISSGSGFIYMLHQDKAAFYRNNNLIVVDYSQMEVLMNLNIPGLAGVCYINEDEIIAFARNGDVFYRISIQQKKILEEIRGIIDQENRPVTGNLRNFSRIDESRFVITTLFSGFYIFDISNRSIYRWEHDPSDPRSLGGNNTYTSRYDSSGYLFVTTLTSGLHFFNLKKQQITSKPYFIDSDKDLFDGYIQSITTDKNGTVWMAAQDRLIKWDRKKNITTYIPVILPDGTKLSGQETFRVVKIDESGNLWAGTTRKGIIIYNSDMKLKAHLSTEGNNRIPSNWISEICSDDLGNHWVGTIRGLCYVNKNDFKVRLFDDHDVLSEVSQTPVHSLWIDHNSNLWIGTTKGVYCYEKSINKLTHYGLKDGLSGNIVIAINHDLYGNIYFGTTSGLSILSKEKKLRSFNRTNGLQHDRCEGILRDEKGQMWIGNLNCILKYDPLNNNFVVFEDGFGFNHAGFRMRTAHKTREGEFIWGTDKGINWFDPEKIADISQNVRPFINALQYADTTYLFTGQERLYFPYNASDIIFSYSSGELTGISKTRFQYKLEGSDDSWQNPVSPGQAIYNKLPSGRYTFFLKASRDGINWHEAPYTIDIDIAYPWWKQNWFRVLVFTIILIIIYYISRYFQNRKKARELQSTIQYFANSGYEHSSVDDILWDICRNVISRMGFEDCVIYMPDHERQVYVQKAAFGNKSINNTEIFKPIEIPFGQGIVGQVALSGQASIIGDTSKSTSYIKDDEERLSELTVPIIHDGQVIGIIDSENAKKNFYTLKHLETLETIASLCAAKISRSMAIEMMAKSEKELMTLNIKMAESRFMNLRLQMNPHFLFNALSAIQHLIVSQQTIRAYKYLTVFSNFLRSLLNHADKNFISLDEEVRILKMYIELESLRFDQNFSWEINVDENLDIGEILLPTMIIQPFAENAIWHGLLHRNGEKKLKIHFLWVNEDYLKCIIEDNGIGRSEAASIRKNNLSSKVHQSKGIEIIQERLRLLKQKTSKSADLEIIDIMDTDANPAGTRVIITIPFYNPEES